MMIWCEDFRDEVYPDAAMQDVRRYRGLGFMLGKSLAGRFPSDAAILVRSETPTDFFMAGSFPVVSLKLKELLDSFGIIAEYFEVSLLDVNGRKIVGKWYCFNIPADIDCFDRRQATFTNEMGFATKIERVAIDECNIGTIPLVLVAKTVPMLILARDDVAQSIVRAGCTGIVFKSCSEWRNPVRPVN